MLWLQRLESAVVCIASMGKAGPESRKLLILHFSTGKKGVLLILLGKSRQMLGNISKLSKWWKKQLEENLLIVVWRLQNENSGKVKKRGGTLSRTSLHPGHCWEAVPNPGINRFKAKLKGICLCLSC